MRLISVPERHQPRVWQRVRSLVAKAGGMFVPLALLASCATPGPVPVPQTGAAPVRQEPSEPAPQSRTDAASKLATLRIGASKQADARTILGSPNETETDKVPCDAAAHHTDLPCMRTTVTWTYFQVRNGKLNAQSSSSPIMLTFDQDGVLRSIGGDWTDIPATQQLTR